MTMISFAWTTPALLAGQKTMTRREWQSLYARKTLAACGHPFTLAMKGDARRCAPCRRIQRLTISRRYKAKKRAEEQAKQASMLAAERSHA